MSQKMHDPDQHAPFPHVITKTMNGDEFVICAVCSHWIGRPCDACNCRVSCHAEARAENLPDYGVISERVVDSDVSIPRKSSSPEVFDHEHTDQASARPARRTVRRASGKPASEPARKPARKSGR